MEQIQVSGNTFCKLPRSFIRYHAYDYPSVLDLLIELMCPGCSKVAGPGDPFYAYDVSSQVTPLYASEGDLSTPNITCGRAAFKMLGQTDIADVVAGKTCPLFSHLLL
jgi:hypothetical protein